ncbi:hypothetical protein WME91_41160 [Sorangium sp. So ce269]
MFFTDAIGDKFFSCLQGIDQEIARQVARAGCPWCGGPLDRSDYDRKPRGDRFIAATVELPLRRISLCCRREGCRRRRTPPSVVFLGRRVYLGAVVIVASTMARRAMTTPFRAATAARRAMTTPFRAATTRPGRGPARAARLPFPEEQGMDPGGRSLEAAEHGAGALRLRRCFAVAPLLRLAYVSVRPPVPRHAKQDNKNGAPWKLRRAQAGWARARRRCGRRGQRAGYRPKTPCLHS